MKELDYPNLYRAANKASIKSQKWYLNSIRVYLLLLLLSATVSKYAPKDVIWAAISAITLLTTLLLSIYQALKRYDVIWYNGRAVAESVKTRTWRFIMQTEPYKNDNSLEITTKIFLNDINEVLNENKKLGQYLSDDGKSNAVTEVMLIVRSMSLPDRREYYKTNRVDDQRSWYAKEAKWNNRQSVMWFWLMICSNSLAVVFVILQVAYPQSERLPIEIVILIASSILTWMQAKRFQDLSTSYNLTAHEITILRQTIDFCDTENKLSDYVKDAENAFSREHTQWIARKDR